MAKSLWSRHQRYLRLKENMTEEEKERRKRMKRENYYKNKENSK